MAGTPQRTDIDLNEFRALLLEQRSQIVGTRRSQAEGENEEDTDSNDNDVSTGYPSDGSSDADEMAAELADRDRYEAGDEAEHEMLHQIDAALGRIENGSYGICTVTGKPIPVERLQAIPWTETTVEGAEQTGL